jgi:hypothetical protein
MQQSLACERNQNLKTQRSLRKQRKVAKKDLSARFYGRLSGADSGSYKRKLEAGEGPIFVIRAESRAGRQFWAHRQVASYLSLQQGNHRG